MNVNVELTVELHQKLKKLAVDEGRSLRKQIMKMLEREYAREAQDA